MFFDALYQPYASNRFPLAARNGMVATSSNLASAAGLEALRKGGNAVDAAVATAAALTVVEPTSNGLGSDAFALVWIKDDEKLYGMNSSGRAPKNISAEKVLARVTDGKMPKHGWLPVMVPGAVSGWAALSERFGKLSLAECLEPAIRYAKDGYPITPLLTKAWKGCTETYHRLFGDRPEFKEYFRVFTKDGKPYEFGDIVKLPDIAKSLKLIAEQGRDVFYKGEIAEALVRQSERDGGYFCMEDMAEYQTDWVEPIGVNYRGYDVWEIPPNGQGITALMALNILKEFEFKEKNCFDTYHTQLEAMKLAFADSLHYVTDASKMKIDYHDLLRPEYGAERAKLIGRNAQVYMPGTPPSGGTVYLCTADGEGNMVSYIQSNFWAFGSGIVVEDYGVSLQSRGATFSLDAGDANYLEPGKKSYHTIIPGFLTKDGKAVGPFGVMGAYMQPQGHVQVIMNMLDFGLNPQMALDAPRWQWLQGKKVALEASFDTEIARQLAARGHEIEIFLQPDTFGRGQIILRLDNGVLVGGTESRTDSNIACW